jgi:hypothetical protein
MKTLNLRPHGTNIKPIYATGSDNPSWAGSSTDAERPDGQVSGIVKRFAKSLKAADKPTALGLLKTQFPHALELTGISHEVRGLIFFTSLLAGAIGIGFGNLFFFGLIERGLEDGFIKFMLCVSTLFFVFGFYFLLWGTRCEFFRPVDEPIIFDRKHRKVYRLFRETHPGWKGLLKRWPMRAAEYEWDLIDVEHNAVLMTTGSTITRLHNLIFIVRRSATDPTIIDSFEVGNTIQLGETTVAPLWEHIRRFMEEQGPHIPAGEALITSKPPATLWQSMGAVGPIGPDYFSLWKTQRGTMIFYHILFPFFLPMFLLWGLFNWLSYKTATPIHWPQEVLDAVQSEPASP